MILKYYKPITSSQRFLKQINYSHLSKFKKLKFYSKSIHRSFGKMRNGQLSSYHKGGGHKRIYRFINSVIYNSGIVENLEYDPNRSAFLVRVFNLQTKKSFYQLASEYLQRGDIISFNFNYSEPTLGSSSSLYYMPLGTIIHNVQFSKNSKNKFSIAAGTYSQIIQKSDFTCIIKLSSGQLRTFPLTLLGTYGRTSNIEHQLRNYGKAGRIRWLNKRPTVRGVAMNPIDHPHGGGQGKTTAGRHPVTPWGKLTKGVKTVKRINSKIKSKHESIKMEMPL